MKNHSVCRTKGTLVAALVFLSVLWTSSSAQTLVHPESWIPGLLFEAEILRGTVGYVHTLPLTPRQISNEIGILTSSSTEAPALPEEMQATLTYASRIRGLNPQLIRRPIPGLFTRNVVLDDQNDWQLFFGGFVAAEAYGGGATRQGSYLRYEDRQPLVSLDATARYDTLFITRVQSVWRTSWAVYEHETRSSNIPKRPFQDLDLRNFHKAYFFFDFGWIDILIGRDNLRWGLGEQSTLLLSDNVPYYDMIRVSSGSKHWRLTALFSGLSDFEPQMEDEPIAALNKPPRHFFANRLEVIPTSNFKIAVTELTMIFGRYPNLGDLNPLTLGHNLFRNYQNSFLSAEFLYHPVPGVSWYAEIAADEIALGLGSGDSDRPTSLAYIVGARGVMFPFMLTAEYTWIDKWFYSYRSAYDPFARPLELDAVEYDRTQFRDIRMIPMGHWLSPDSRSIYFQLRTSRALPMLANVEFEHRQRGEVGLSTLYLDPQYAGQSTPTGVVETADVLTVSAGGGFTQFFVRGSISAYWVENDGNVLGKKRRGSESALSVSFYF